MHGKRRGLNEVGVMGRVAMKGWAVGCSERQVGGEKQKYDTYINSSSGLLFYLFSNFFQNQFEFQLKLSCPAPC